eukprot:1699520-Pleurochrysis_carterae.AAC.1
MAKRRSLDPSPSSINTQFRFRDANSDVYRHIFSYLALTEKANFLAAVPEALERTEKGGVEVDKRVYFMALRAAIKSDGENNFRAIYRLMQLLIQNLKTMEQC